LKTVVDRLLDVSDSQEEPPLYEIGDRVRHDRFGDGVIENISGSGVSMKVKVHFKDVGPKLLLLSMANLKKI
jgi:DNA helicase II / ATP-dependent DNA helicase PcrA